MECKHLDQVPPVVNEWQTVLCPNCKHYHVGKGCVNPNRHTAADACPFDNKPLPLREVTENEVPNAKN